MPRVLLAISAGLGSALGVFFVLRRRQPGRVVAIAAGVGLAVAAALTFLGPFAGAPKRVIEVVLPDRYRGFVYIFLDSRQHPMSPSSPHVYTLFVPPTGKLRAGQFEDGAATSKNVSFALRYLNGEVAPVAEGSQTGGSRTEKGGGSALYIRPFIGSSAEFEAARVSAPSDPFRLLEEMRAAAQSPPSTKPAATLEGIERAPSSP